jgi:hypothetical protein
MLAVAVASYTPLHENGTRNENCTSDELGGASVVGVDGVVVEGVDGSGWMVVEVEGVVVDVEYVMVSSSGAGRQLEAGVSLAENSTCRTTDEIGAGGECLNTPLNTASLDVEKLDGAVNVEPCHGSVDVCWGAACDRDDPTSPSTTSAASVSPALVSTFTDLARERWIVGFMLLAATTMTGRWATKVTKTPGR